MLPTNVVKNKTKQNKSTSNSVSLYVYNPCPYLKPFHSIIGVLSWDRYILTQYFHKPDISSYKAGLVRKPPTLRHQLMCLKTFYSKFVSTFHKLLIFSPPLHWRCIQCNQEETKSVCVYKSVYNNTVYGHWWMDRQQGPQNEPATPVYHHIYLTKNVSFRMSLRRPLQRVWAWGWCLPGNHSWKTKTKLIMLLTY